MIIIIIIIISSEIDDLINYITLYYNTVCILNNDISLVCDS